MKAHLCDKESMKKEQGANVACSAPVYAPAASAAIIHAKGHHILLLFCAIVDQRGQLVARPWHKYSNAQINTSDQAGWLNGQVGKSA